LDVFLKRDADRLEELMKVHIMVARDKFLQFLQCKGEEKALKIWVKTF